ncbi:phage tail tape measure protein [Alkalicoccobacillus gibsonii]|uniref:phage tail tape measure protein n=1 Tax=Alkalicoccobacillus gibsonii TaxID=79881 RepID=UPI003512A070
MSLLSDILVKVGLDMKDFDKKMKDIGTKTQNIGKSMQKTGTTLTKAITLPTALAGGAILKLGVDFEKSMSKVEALTGAGAAEMDLMTETAKELGKTTVFSASEAADGMAFLGMAGYDTTQILDSMDGMLNLAAASGMDLANTADIATNILSGFGLEADQTGRMADVLAAASSSANTDVAQLGQAMVSLAPNASALGWELEETTAAVNAMANAGIQGEKAGRAFATSLNRLAAPVGRGKDVIEELGLEFFNLDGTMKSMPEVIEEMERGFEGMTDQQRAAALSAIVGQESYKHWNTLLAQGSDKLAENVVALEEAEGAAKTLADIMNDNLGGAFKEFTSKLEGAAIDIYNSYLPALESILETANDLAEKFNNLDDETKKQITDWVLLAAAIGPILTVLGTVVIFVGHVITAFRTIISVFRGLSKVWSGIAKVAQLVWRGIMLIVNVGRKLLAVFRIVRTVVSLVPLLPLIMNPVGLIVAGIAAVIAIGVALWKNWDSVKAFAISIWGYISDFFAWTWEKIKQAAVAVWDWLSPYFSDAWQAIVDKASSIWGSIVDFFGGIWTSIKETASSFLDSFKRFFSDAWDSIKSTTSEIFGAIADFFVEWVWGILQWTPIGLFVSFIMENWEAIKDFTKIIFDMIAALIELAFVLIDQYVKPVVKSIVDFIVKWWNKAWETTKSVFTTVKDFLIDLWNTVYGFISDIVSKVYNTIKSWFNKAKAIVSSIAKAIWKVISNKFNEIKDTVMTVLTAVYEVISEKFNAAKDIVTEIASAIWSVVSEKFNEVYNAIMEPIGKAYDFVAEKFNLIKDTVSEAAGNVYETVSGKFNDVKNAIMTPIGDAKDFIWQTLEDIKGWFSGLSLTIPKPKIPKVSLERGSKSIGGVDIPYPKFSVAWNAKGNIFNGASILGGGQGVGEAGAEVVMPVQHKRYMRPFANAVADHMEDMTEDMDGGTQNNFNVEQLVVREEADIEKIARKLYEMQQRNKRNRGR